MRDALEPIVVLDMDLGHGVWAPEVDERAAWELLATRGLVPLEWASRPPMLMGGVYAVPAPGGGVYRWLLPDAVAALAADPAAVLTVEALAAEALHRLEPFRPRVAMGKVTPVVWWCDRGDKLWDLLIDPAENFGGMSASRPPWRAALELTEIAAGRIPTYEGSIGNAEPTRILQRLCAMAQEWDRLAADRDVLLPPTPRNNDWHPPPGGLNSGADEAFWRLAFRDLSNPLDPLASIWAMGYGFDQRPDVAVPSPVAASYVYLLAPKLPVGEWCRR